AARGADGPVGRAGPTDAASAAPRQLPPESRDALLDPPDLHRRRDRPEVDERVRPGRHDADPAVLADPTRPAEDPGEVPLEVVHEALEEHGRPVGAIRGEPARDAPRATGERGLRLHRA